MIRKYSTFAQDVSIGPIGPGDGQLVTGVTVSDSAISTGGRQLQLNFAETPLARSTAPLQTVQQQQQYIKLGDGFYRIFVDTDGNGSFEDTADRVFGFHRLVGDADGSGSVDADDSALIDQLMSATTPGALLNGDLDRNGRIDTADKSYTTAIRWGSLATRKLHRSLFDYLND